MNKEEMKEFCEWALKDEYLSKFRNDANLFCSPPKYGIGFYFLKIDIDNAFVFKPMTVEKNKIHQNIIIRSLGFYGYGYPDKEKLKHLSLADAKKYVYELSMHGLKTMVDVNKNFTKLKLNSL
jgi:hypothetical protein